MCPTHKWVLFGHHFAAIAGAGPLVGPILAAQFGYLPGTFWIIVGVVLAGAVQDFVILCASMRRRGQSLGKMAKEEISPLAGTVALVAILLIMMILMAVLALVIVNALKSSPWGAFTLLMTVPIALFVGSYSCAFYVKTKCSKDRSSASRSQCSPWWPASGWPRILLYQRFSL